MSSSAVEEVKPEPVHYGPIYGRPSGETMALCKPPGTFATMSNSWRAVTCGKCRDQQYNRSIL